MRRNDRHKAAAVAAILFVGLATAGPAPRAAEPESASQDKDVSPKERADALYERGMDAADEEAYEKAAKLFDRAYELVPNFAFLWNAARSHYWAGHYEAAAKRFKEVLAHDELPTKYRPKAAEFLSKARMKQEEAEEDEAEEPESPSSKKEAPEESPSAGTDRDEPSEEQAPSETASDDGQNEREAEGTDTASTSASDPGAQPTVITQRAAETAPPSPWAWASLGTGLAMVGAGVGLHFHAESLRDDVTSAPNDDGVVPPDGPRRDRLNTLESRANTRDTAAIAMMAAGGALTATGVVLALTTGGEADEPSTATSDTSVSLAPLRGGGVLTVRGDFR